MIHLITQQIFDGITFCFNYTLFKGIFFISHIVVNQLLKTDIEFKKMLYGQKLITVIHIFHFYRE